jgi:hypothetical protein
MRVCVHQAARNAAARDEFYRLLADEAAQYLTPRTHTAHLAAAAVPDHLTAASVRGACVWLAAQLVSHRCGVHRNTL